MVSAIALNGELLSADANQTRSEQLRKWYLAGLRKRLFASTNLTPAALVDADRHFIEDVILGEAGKQETAVTPVGMATMLPWWLAWLAGNVVFFVLFLSANSGDLGSSLLQTYGATLGLLLMQASGLHGLDWAYAGFFFGFPFVFVLSATGLSCSRLARNPSFLLLVLVPLVVLFCCLPKSATEQSDLHCLQVIATISAWQLVLGTLCCAIYRAQIVEPVLRLARGLTPPQDAQSSQASVDLDKLEELALALVRSKNECVQRENLIADAAQQIIASFDSDLRILTTNLAAENLLGYLRQELIGKRLTALMLPEDLARSESMIAAARDDKNPVVFDNRVATKDHHALDLRWMVEWSDTERCFFASAEDISAERTLARARQEFVAMIGHDIKVPLTSVMLAVQSVQLGAYGPLSENGKEALERSENSVKRLITLINELLDFEKMEAGKFELKKQPMAIKATMVAAIADVADAAKAKDIEVVLEAADKLSVCADEEKLIRVLVNLLSNAVKFSPAGSPVLVQGVEKEGYFEVSVSDHGPGIAEAYQDLIFDRYERAPSGAGVEGTGLGLAIAKAIVEAHGGMIGVNSTLGEGSTFWFRIPT